MTRQPKPIKHGTNTGYTRHQQNGDTTRWKTGELERCEPCTDAHARYMRNNRELHARLRRSPALPEPAVS